MAEGQVCDVRDYEIFDYAGRCRRRPAPPENVPISLVDLERAVIQLPIPKLDL
jgi:hypothetical protein